MPGQKGNSKSRKVLVSEILERGKAIDDVWDLPIISSSAHERTGYAAALRGLSPLAEGGDARAQFDIGFMHARGWGLRC